ncbi:FAD-dependent oxidoreductase [Derxia lacustris]|uniref:FAD-dependent oxidoreductase n=1 Tax=Derxia lacustris TaxID=764842 RepID=UPI001593E834|nr:FAD-dependent oxidoreductase [Derxia lacustris]
MRSQLAGVGLALGLAACGGGGSGSAGTPAAQPTEVVPVVAFAAETGRSVLPDGTVAFSVARALASGERLVCLAADAASAACSGSASAGVLSYTGLAVGSHALQVELRDATGTLVARASRSIEIRQPEVVVYGATPGGIAAAVAAARAGRSVALLEATAHVGGMMSGGLTKTDLGVNGLPVIGGFAQEFLSATYAAETAAGRCSANWPCDGRSDFEPHVAERVFEQLIGAEANLTLERGARLTGASRSGSRIAAIATTRGSLAGAVFIDASYEGDLMARAGASYTIGREARTEAAAGDTAALELQEDTAGIRTALKPSSLIVDPYVVAGDPSSGTLPFVEPKPASLPPVGSADHRVMAYNYRLCVTDDPQSRVPFTRPADYDPARYEGSARVAQALAASGQKLDELMFRPYRTVHAADPNYYKYDLNGGATFSSDMTAADLNQAYTDADEAGRNRIRAAYRSYISGLLYFWQTDPRFGALNAKVARFGLCADEFTDNGNWPYALYVRESRRLQGVYVLNENDLRQNGRRPAIADVIGMGAYDMDSHSARYYAHSVLTADRSRRVDSIVVEGYLILHLPDDRPYPVPYRSLLPRASEVSNLLVVGAPSVTHLALCSIRMEPTFMVLGQSAGIAAAETLRLGTTLHGLPYERLRPLLLAAGQKLSFER